MESFQSAISRREDEISLLSFAGDDDEQESFLLDINELERVASLARGGVGCRLTMTEKFERATYFLFRVEFVDGCSWDVIVPHSAKLQLQFGTLLEDTLPKVQPELIAWHVGHGMRYIFVKNIGSPQPEIRQADFQDLKIGSTCNGYD